MPKIQIAPIIDQQAVREIYLDEAPHTQNWKDALTELQELSGDTERFGKRIWDLAQFILGQVSTVTQMLEAYRDGKTSRAVPVSPDETFYNRITARYQEQFGEFKKPGI